MVHKYSSFTGPLGEEIFEAYAENKTPAAYRIFWYYGPGKNNITIIAILRPILDPGGSLPLNSLRPIILLYTFPQPTNGFFAKYS